MLTDFKLFNYSYSFLLWLWLTISKFPKSERYVLGEKLKKTSLKLLRNIISFNNTTSNKKSYLENANLELETLRVFIRLCLDIKIINFQKYEVASKQLDEIGKLLGGLISKQIS